MTNLRKKEIVKHRQTHLQKGENSTKKSLTKWAKLEFRLNTLPGKAVISKIIFDAEVATNNKDLPVTYNSLYMLRFAKHVEHEVLYLIGLCDVRCRRRYILGVLFNQRNYRSPKRLKDISSNI